MKKVFFLLAVAGMFSFAACKHNAEKPATEETPATEQLEAPAEEAVENAIDETAEVAEEAVETVVAE